MGQTVQARVTKRLTKVFRKVLKDDIKSLELLTELQNVTGINGNFRKYLEEIEIEIEKTKSKIFINPTYKTGE